MKKFQGFSAVGVILGLVAIILLGAGIFAVIDGNNRAAELRKYDFYSVIEPTASNGMIGDHVKGNPDAPVLIFEYADYQCPACASMNKRINKIVEESDGKLAVVYRNFLLSYHQNGTAAAAAAEAAGLQGYWKEYADKLFSKQAEWEYASASERTEYFNKYFVEVTNGEGDIDKFNQDIASEAVFKKISFDMKIAQRAGVAGTPMFYVDGQLIDLTNKQGGSVTVNGEVISWDSVQSGDKFAELLKRIIEVKTR